MNGRNWTATDFQEFVGKVVSKVEDADGDEGLRITFADGAVLEFGFSSCYGTIETAIASGDSLSQAQRNRSPCH